MKPQLPLRLLNWCRRFRHRCGYGVHSPSDFFLITSVIYERLPYYAYTTLRARRKDFPEGNIGYREKVDKLLFRLANHFQPTVWVESSHTENTLTPCYISAACPHARLLTVDEAVGQGTVPDLVHLSSDDYADEYTRLLPLVGSRTCLIVGHPYANRAKSAWWKGVIASQEAVVTFDLYDIGLVFFDRKRYKEHRIVNFF